MARPRVILAIETSNPSAWTEGQATRPGVALAREGSGGALEVLGVRGLDPTRPHDDELMPEIDGLLSAASLRPRDLTDVAVSVGPGGYTAVRLAVTTAKLIAEGTGARAIPVPSALVVAWGMVPALRAKGVARFAVAISSKGQTTFLTCFETTLDGARALEAGVVIGGDGLGAKLDALGAKALIGDRFLPTGIVDAATAMGIELLAPEFDPVACLRASAARNPEPPERWPQQKPDQKAQKRRREPSNLQMKSQSIL